jgi:hypothetical protein
MRRDWERVKERWEHWWAGGCLDRPLLQLSAPRDGAPAAEPWRGGQATEEERWTDIDFAIHATEHDLRATWRGGESLPALASYKSPLGMSAGGALLFGCTASFAEDTVWVDPLPGGVPAQLRPDPARRARLLDCFARAGRSSRGRFWIRESFGNHAGDTLAALRGTERLLVDLLEDPATVRRGLEQVTDIYQDILDEAWPLVSPGVIGLEGWLSTAGTWSPGVNFCADCDVSCMVSPRQFEDVFLPPLVRAMRAADHVIYHLDGTDALRHLDALLALPEVEAIQWVPGAGREAILQWVPLVRRIQAAGRSVQAIVRPEEVLPLVDAVPPEGLLCAVSCGTRAAGEALLEAVERRFARGTAG